MLSNKSFRLLLFAIVLSVNGFSQSFEPSDSIVVNADVNYEVNYFVSNGNYNSIRILTDGVLLKYETKNGHVKTKFIENKKLDYYQFLKIQLFIDSIAWNVNSIVPKSDSIQVLGLPETIQILHTESLKSRVYFLKYSDSETINTLVNLINNYIPKRYKKKITIPIRK